MCTRCLMCGIFYKDISGHLLKSHNITIEEYDRLCSDENEFIQCQICKEDYKELGAHLLRKHGMNTKDYQEKYSNAPVVSKTNLKDRSKRMSGANNSIHKIKDKAEYSLTMSKAMTGIKRTPEQKINYSVGACKRIANGSGFGYKNCKRGWTTLPRLQKKVYFASSYEEAALLNIDSVPEVVSIQVNKIRVPYEFLGVVHSYLIDYEITLNNGCVCLVEVKCDYELTLPQTQAKISAGRSFASENGFMFQVWTKKICFDFNSVTTMLKKAISSATATDQNGRRYSLNPRVTVGRKQK